MKQVLNSLMGLREGNSLPLRVATVELRWSTERMAVDNGNCSGPVECPVKYSAQEISQCRNELKQVAGSLHNCVDGWNAFSEVST